MIEARKGDCGGDRARCSLGDRCPLFGTLGREDRRGVRRIKGCGDPMARGRRNRSKGDSKARRARKKLNLVGANTRHEEHWRGRLRVEIKSGKQIEPIATRFDAAKHQSDQSKAIGDIRPFAMVAMPDGSSDGIVLMSLEEFSEILALIES